MNRELSILGWARLLGYVNLAALTISLFYAKMSLALMFIPATITIVGACAYSFFWNSLFRSVPKEIGRRYASPFIVGCALLVSAAVLIVSLLLMKAHS